MGENKIKSRLIYFLFGAVSLLAQVILIRRLLAVFYGNELTIGALFAGWMFWFGAGGLIFARDSGRSKNPEIMLAIIFFLSAIAFVLSAGATWAVNAIFGIPQGAMAGFGTILLAGFILSAPVCVLLGAGFNYAASGFGSGEQNLVRLYLYEALGSAAAGVLSLVMAGKISASGQILFCGLLCAFAGALSLSKKKNQMIATLLAAAVFAGLAIFSGRIEKHLVNLRWPGQEVALEKESKYSTITITREPGQVSFWLDGFLAFSHPDPELSEYAVHLPMAMTPWPRRVLLIGGGLTGPGSEALKYKIDELVYVQIDGSLPALEEKFISEFSSLKKDSRVKIINRDAWIFLRENKTKFDAVILNFSSTGTASTNRYFTREFFELVKKNLNPEGVLGMCAGSSGNYLSDGQAALLANSVVTLNQVFSKVAVLPLMQNYLVASEESMWVSEYGKEIIAKTMGRGIETKYVRAYYLIDNLNEKRLLKIKMRLSEFMDQPANTVLHPSGYYLSSLLWLEEASPEWRGAIKEFLKIRRGPVYLFLAGFLFLGAAAVFWKGVRAFADLSIFAAGFAGIAAELVLLLAFQSAYGYVFYLVGILVAGFMAGLAAGAYLYQRFLYILQRLPLLSLVLILLCETVSLLLCSAGVLALFKYSPAQSWTIILILSLMMLVAVFSGLAFPICAHVFGPRSGSGTGDAAGRINAWDHFGAAIGAFLASAFMVPLFGLTFGLWFSAVLIFAGLVAGLALLRSV